MKIPLFAWIPVVAGILFAGAGCGRRAADTPPDPAVAGTLIRDAIPLPASLAAPSDLPPCPGLLSVEDAAGDERNGSVRLLSGESSSSLLDFYETQLSANGWVLASSLRQGQTRHMQFRQGVRFLRLQVGPAPEKHAAAQIRMAWGMPEGAPLALESQAPDYEEEMSEAEPPSHEW